MKYYIFLLLGLYSFAQKSNGAIFQFNFTAEYVPAKITFYDGHAENGFIYGFIENRKFEINIDLGFSFGSIENDLNLNDKVFDFKNDLKGEKRRLTVKDINEVVLIDKNSNFTVYRLFDIKKANNKNKIVDTNVKIWLPLIKKGIVNIYGYDLYTKYTNKKYAKHKLDFF